MANPTAAEYQLVRQTADAYRDQGYEVSIDEELDFLPGFRADLLARKGDRVKVIEVKTRSALANVRELDELARATNEKPGWSFELLLVAEAEQLGPPRGRTRSTAGTSLGDWTKPNGCSATGTPSRRSCWPGRPTKR